MSIRSRLDRLERDNPPPQCGPRGLRVMRHGEVRSGVGEPLSSPCPACGDPDCGITIIEEVVVVRDAEGNLRDEDGNLVEKSAFASCSPPKGLE